MLDCSLGIFDHVTRYLSGEIELSDLETWVVAHLGRLLADPHSTSYRLAGTVELGLAELAAGDITEDEFRDLLVEFELTNTNVIVDLSSAGSFATSTNTLVPLPSPYLVFGARPGQPVRYERIQLEKAS
jgi:hypothetical protein